MKATVFFLIFGFFAPWVGAQTLPSAQDVERKMQELKAIIPSTIDRAAKDSGTAARRVQPTSEQARLPTKPVLDPATVARQYAEVSQPSNPADKATPVMVFVSLSMPTESLKQLARESARSGVPLLVRGLKYGVGQENVRRGLQELRPYSEIGATILVHPEAFDNYSVSVVPTFVVDPDASAGCADGLCPTRARRVVGEVTLQFALEEIAQDGGDAGRIARDTATALRRSAR